MGQSTHFTLYGLHTLLLLHTFLIMDKCNLNSQGMIILSLLYILYYKEIYSTVKRHNGKMLDVQMIFPSILYLNCYYYFPVTRVLEPILAVTGTL